MIGRGLGIDLGPLRRSGDFRLLFVGGGISFAGGMLTFVAVPYQAYRLTGSSLVVGFLSVAELAAMLATGAVGGVLADAVDRRRMLRLTEAGLAGGSVVLTVNALVGRHLWVLFAVAFLQSGLSGLQRPSLEALAPRLVPPEDLAASSALMALRSQIGMVAVPALAGTVIAAAGLVTAYGLDVATFGVSLLALSRIGAAPPPSAGVRLTGRSLVQGLAYARARRDLLGTYLVDANAMLFGMPNALFPQLAAGLGGAATLGLLYAAPAAGSLGVTLFSGWCGRVSRQGLLVAAGAAAWGGAIIGLGFAGRLWEAAAALVVAGGADMVSGLGRLTMWNESVPDALRGRLAGIEFLSYSVGPAIGNAEAGAVEALAGLRTSIVSGGVLCLIGTAVITAALPSLRRYRSEDGRRLRLQGSGTPDATADTAPALPLRPTI